MEKTFTLAELADAIEKNGLPQIRYGLFQTRDRSTSNYLSLYEEEEVIGACALGQAFINLGVDNENVRGTHWQRVCTFIVDLNDNKGKSFAYIAGALRQQYKLTNTFRANTRKYKVKKS